jgi:hypothetical protein
MDENNFDSNLIEMMMEETLDLNPQFSATFDEKSKAYSVRINNIILEVPSNWSCFTVSKAGDILFPDHFLEVLEPEVGLGTLESISIIEAFDNSLQLDVRVSNLTNLKAA